MENGIGRSEAADGAHPVNNAGIIQGIGDDSTRPRWALELGYQSGLPSGDWLAYGLQYIKAHAMNICWSAPVSASWRIAGRRSSGP